MNAIDLGFRRLMIAVMRQAAFDLRSRDPIKSLDALLFFTDGESKFYFEELDMPQVDGLDFLTSGRAHRLNKRSFQ